GSNVFKALLHAPFFLDELQDWSHEFISAQNESCDDRLFDLADELSLREFRRIIDFFDLSVGVRDAISHAWSRCDERKLKLAFEAFLDDLHVKQAKESASKTKTQCRRCLWFVEKG